jgi:filamentous hemagglutinin family protein
MYGSQPGTNKNSAVKAMAMKPNNKIKRSVGANKGKGGAGGREPVPFTRTPLACCLAALLGGAPFTAYAGPEGGQVTGGDGAITYGQTTTITQNSSSLAIDWQSFNVSADEAVKFVQPSSSSVVLNRILDQNPSEIFGSIDANGRVFLSNPNGLIFGATATINVGSLVATGLDISSEEFMAGNYNLGTVGSDGGVVINRGLIQAATGGSVTLVGSSVQNEGVIIADYGTVNMGAGQTAVLDFDGDGLLRFEVDGEVLCIEVGFARLAA